MGGCLEVEHELSGHGCLAGGQERPRGAVLRSGAACGETRRKRHTSVSYLNALLEHSLSSSACVPPWRVWSWRPFPSIHLSLPWHALQAGRGGGYPRWVTPGSAPVLPTRWVWVEMSLATSKLITWDPGKRTGKKPLRKPRGARKLAGGTTRAVTVARERTRSGAVRAVFTVGMSSPRLATSVATRTCARPSCAQRAAAAQSTSTGPSVVTDYSAFPPVSALRRKEHRREYYTVGAGKRSRLEL